MHVGQECQIRKPSARPALVGPPSQGLQGSPRAAGPLHKEAIFPEEIVLPKGKGLAVDMKAAPAARASGLLGLPVGVGSGHRYKQAPAGRQSAALGLPGLPSGVRAFGGNVTSIAGAAGRLLTSIRRWSSASSCSSLTTSDSSSWPKGTRLFQGKRARAGGPL